MLKKMLRRLFKPWVFCLAMSCVAFLIFNYRVNRGPHDELLEPIAREYYSCDKCGSLEGGIYGKGPMKSFRSQAGRWCVHDWKQISRDEFKRAGAERFGIDWSQEIPFWSDD